MTTIRYIVPYDLCFPTSETLADSDAMYPAPDYSAAYAWVQTDGPLTGYGMTFTIGRGTEVVCAAISALAPIVVSHSIEEIVMDWPTFWHRLTSDSQCVGSAPKKTQFISPPDGRMCEYAHHLHEHFVHPALIKEGHYIMPTHPGLSMDLNPTTLTHYGYLHGEVCHKEHP